MWKLNASSIHLFVLSTHRLIEISEEKASWQTTSPKNTVIILKYIQHVEQKRKKKQNQKNPTPLKIGEYTFVFP